MNVQNAVGKSVDEDAAQNAHEAREDYQRDLVFLQHLYGLSIKFFPGTLTRWNVNGIQSSITGPLKTGRVFDVADNDSDFRFQFSCGNLIGYGFEVRAAAGK